MKFSKTFVLLLLITLLGFALRVYQLDYFSLRGDEAFTVLFVQKPLAQMWYETLTVEPNPPLLYFLLRWWIELAGDSEFITRFFSLVFGVLSIPALYRAGRAMFSSRAVGLVAAFIIAINPYQIWHSQDVRNYTLWPLFTILALLFFWNWYSSRKGNPQSPKRTSSPIIQLSIFCLFQLIALYAHYFEAFILLALNLFVFATLWRELRKLAQWLVAQFILAVLYLPYPLILSNRVSSYGEGSGRMGVPLADVARETVSSFFLSDTLEPNLRAWLWIPFGLVALAALVILWLRDWRRGLFFSVYLGIPTLAVFALNTFRPLYLERYLNGIAPAYYLLLSFGIVALIQKVSSLRLTSDVSRQTLVRRVSFAVVAIILAIVAFLALNTYWTNPAYAKSPFWRELTDIINQNAQPGDIIVQNFPEMSLLYYDSTRLPVVVYPETFLPDNTTNQQLNAMNANYQRAWFIPAATDVWDPDQYVESWLDRRDDLLQHWRVGDFRLRLYATPSQYLNTMQKTDQNLNNLFSLIGYRTQPEGSDLLVTLYWRALQKPDADYEFSVRGLDANGSELGVQRSAPVNGAFPTTEWAKGSLVVDQHLISGAAAAYSFELSLCTPEVCTPAAQTLPVSSSN